MARGLKPGTLHKNALKDPEERHTVTKYVSYKSRQWESVQEEMKALGIRTHSEFIRLQLFGEVG